MRKLTFKKGSEFVSRAIRSRYESWWIDQQIDLRGQVAADHIASLISGPRPAMVCRLGTGELNTIVHLDNILKGCEQFRPQDYEGFEKNAGFFPVRRDLIERYYHRMVQDLRFVDLLGSWIYRESQFKKELKQAKKCPLVDLEPYFHSRPWSSELADKSVLVVHPFVKTIEAQYARREALFANPGVLPKFELKTIQSVQSIGSTHGRRQFSDWFEALESMEEKISQTEFDVAIIGCGAYGLPLAAHVKRIGRKAIHLGGATQILFGIKGKRWEDIPAFSRFFNEYWVRASEEDRPDNYKEIEGGSYW